MLLSDIYIYIYDRKTKKITSKEIIEIKEGTIDDSELKRIMLEEFLAAHPDAIPK